MCAHSSKLDGRFTNFLYLFKLLRFVINLVQEGGIAIEARQLLLKRAAEGTINFVMNKFSIS